MLHVPAESVGLYVPGGSAVLPSSALMLTVPAAIAGCKTIVLATPPRPDGSITPEVRTSQLEHKCVNHDWGSGQLWRPCTIFVIPDILVLLPSMTKTVLLVRSHDATALSTMERG